LHCDLPRFSSRTTAGAGFGNQPSTVLAESPLNKGSAMLIRSQMDGIFEGAAFRAGIPAASAPALLPGGLLLLIGP